MGRKCLQKKRKIHLPTKTGNISFGKPRPEYKYNKIPSCSSRRPRFDVSHDFDESFCQKDWEELAKATDGITSALQFIPTTFSSTSVTTFMTSCPPAVCWSNIF